MTEFLSRIAVVAHVRISGSIGKFYPCTFDLMLDQRQPQDKQLREAIRILQQCGYETRGVSFAPVPGN